MPRNNISGLATRERLDRILGLIAEETGPVLSCDKPVAGCIVPDRYGRKRPLAEQLTRPHFKMTDPRLCLQVIKAGAENLFFGAWAERRRIAGELLDLRDVLSHYKRKITDDDARNAADWARQLLRGLGLHEAAERVGDLALPPRVAYVADLRNELVAVAKRRGLITYERVLESLKLSKDDLGYRKVFRQLNVLAAKQVLLNEPQLCALVILKDKGMPGEGFFWVLDVDRDDSESAKRAAHQAEVKRVHREYRYASREMHRSAV
jgi:hypothetical protein